MKSNDLFQYIFTAALCLCFFIFGKACNKSQTQITTFAIDSSRTTNVYPATTINKSGGFDIRYVEKPIPVYIDTHKIIKEHFTARFYSQEIRDTVAEVYANIQDSIYKNYLIYRAVTFKNLRPTAISVTPPKPKMCFFVGGNIIGDLSQNNLYNIDIAPQASIQLKNQNQISLGYGILNKQVHAGYLWKVK